MPRPASDDRAYLPGLDGVRALAVVVVLGYHLGFPAAAGGLLGVGVFFTLSGFLITRVLLGSWARTGTLELRRFWVHRARRLLPALALVLLVVLAAAALSRRDSLSERWGESWSAALYVANWHTIASEKTYFDRFGGPGPLDHLWSLSVEEQFYLIWPVILLVALSVLRVPRRTLIRFTVALTAVSFALLVLLASPGFDNTRAYEGTDTRAGGILIGALLALTWDRIQAAVRTPLHVVVADVLGLVGLAGIGWLIVTTDDYSMSLYSYGLLLLSVCTAAVVAAVSLPGSMLGRVLGVRPLVWIGERSYGLYLWQLPVIASVSVASIAEHRVLMGIVLTLVTVLLAELSWRFVEDPIRRLGLVRALQLVRRRTMLASDGTWYTRRLRVIPVGIMATILVGTTSMVMLRLIDPGGAAPAGVAAVDRPPVPSDAGRRAGPGAREPAVTMRRGVAQTSCTRDVHIGESTSVGLVDPAYLARRSERLPAQLRRRGVEQVRTDIAGARSIFERWNGEPNARDAVDAQLDDGYDGCWTIAMGTNDAANQAVGGVYSFRKRIDELMKPLAGQPVLWLTVKSQLSSGPYADSQMREFNDALRDACRRYPSLRLYDWRAEVRDAWFISDGIHYTARGYAQRARRIAAALAVAFPAGAPAASGCVVRSTRR